MWRLIIVTFGFLGFSFYELSGGNEFQAESWPAVAEPVQVAESDLADAPMDNLVLASVSTKNTNEETLSLTPLVEPEKAQEVVAKVEPVVAPEPRFETRLVKGNRVNFRNGPGKTYSVMGKLTGGEETIILSEPGNGWVKIRTEDGDIGWIADFLLIAS